MAYLEKLLILTGTEATQAKKDSEAILKLETEIAKSHSTPVELRNPESNYNKLSVEALDKLAPNLAMKSFLATIRAKTDTVLIRQPKYTSVR